MLRVLGYRVFVERGGCDSVVELCVEDVEETEGNSVECRVWFCLL